jgi:hypothetical protein
MPGWPSFDYLQAQDPEDAHRAIADARRQSPIALGAARKRRMICAVEIWSVL